MITQSSAIPFPHQFGMNQESLKSHKITTLSPVLTVATEPLAMVEFSSIFLPIQITVLV